MFQNSSMLSQGDLKDRNKLASKQYRDRKKQQEMEQQHQLQNLENQIKSLMAENHLLKTQNHQDVVVQQMANLTYEIQKLSAIIQNQPIPSPPSQQQPDTMSYTGSNTSMMIGVAPQQQANQIKYEEDYQMMDIIDEPSNNFIFVFLFLIVLILPAFIFPNIQNIKRSAGQSRIIYSLNYSHPGPNTTETGVQVQSNYDFNFDKYQECVKYAESGLDLFGFTSQKLEDFCKEHCKGLVHDEEMELKT